jgi:Ni2+-binding GTPase involved in maturation of urease and hydrogenase
MRNGPALVLVGGFLGAGKTTLLLHAANRLAAAGARVGIITNDQAPDLVDTHYAQASGFAAEEISGGCFCCRFSEFARSAGRLLEQGMDVIFAEPVGSCMDISSTILQPVKKYYGDRFRLAPYTVLVDPDRARRLLAPDADPLQAYLFSNQIAEADLVCFSKADLYEQGPISSEIAGQRLSARTGEGVPEWLALVLDGASVAGQRLLTIDYSRYAEAEAALGWLNWRAEYRPKTPLSPLALVGPIFDELDRLLTNAAIDIAHLKAFDRTPTGYIKASICHNGEDPVVVGDRLAAPTRHHDLTINLRALGAPEVLRDAMESAITVLPGKAINVRVRAFRPEAPSPEHRFDQIL